jgi:hypothetical protein
MPKNKTQKFEFNCVLEDIHRRKKGSKSCKDPHTAFKVLTREINEDEMDALMHGVCSGSKICLKIEVVKENKN